MRHQNAEEPAPSERDEVSALMGAHQDAPMGALMSVYNPLPPQHDPRPRFYWEEDTGDPAPADSAVQATFGG